jgi:hypothetical protein
MYPHERSLVSKLSGKPFVLIGVNSDPDRNTLKKRIDEEKLAWRSFWDGGSTAGPISSKWQILSWPTLVLIDHKGIIRHRRRGVPIPTEWNKAIADLVKEAEASR